MLGSLHLTRPNKDLYEKQLHTAPGMAHFAGTGPRGKTCRDCEHFACSGPEYFSKRGIRGGELKPSYCGKYRDLMGRLGDRVPHEKSSCKYFEARETPLPRYSK